MNKFTLMRNYKHVPRHDMFGTKRVECWEMIEQDIPTAHEAVALQQKQDVPNDYVIIRQRKD